MDREPRVLIVDDSQFIRDWTSTVLFRNGYHIFTANSGETALIKARNIKPEVIILDIDLTGISGIETCRRLREIGLAAKIIMRTIERSNALIKIAKEAGCDEYLSKEQDGDQLLKTIKEVLSK